VWSLGRSNTFTCALKRVCLFRCQVLCHVQHQQLAAVKSIREGHRNNLCEADSYLTRWGRGILVISSEWILTSKSSFCVIPIWLDAFWIYHLFLFFSYFISLALMLQSTPTVQRCENTPHMKIILMLFLRIYHCWFYTNIGFYFLQNIRYFSTACF
jgi:hypothetical protein